VIAPMRRTIFLALLATLLLVPAARAADSEQIWQDCKDSVLQGHYTTAELRKADSSMPSDVSEYTDCHDVISRAIAAKTSSSGSKGGGSGGGGGGGGGGSSSNGGGSGGSGSGAGGADTPDSTPAAPVTPSTPQDQAALTEAATSGNQPVTLDGKAVLPGGASRLAADVGRNPLPTTLVLVLIMLALAALLGGGVRVRNRVLGHRQP
jgi:hypothetical protein